MSRFSKGPWRATTTPAGKGKVVDAHGFSVANATAARWEDGLADARLIAAAPCLYEALRECEEVLRQYARTIDSPLTQRAMEITRAALAKVQP